MIHGIYEFTINEWNMIMQCSINYILYQNSNNRKVNEENQNNLSNYSLKKITLKILSMNHIINAYN